MLLAINCNNTNIKFGVVDGDRIVGEWRRHGFETVRAAWLAKAGPIGAEVDVKLGEELVSGRFAGLDREGALLLDTAAGPRKIVSGELLGRAA